jgi:plasmid maintenance system killer protein
MIINKTSLYKKCISKLKKSHKGKELTKVQMLEEILTNHNSLQELMVSSMWKTYRFEKLIGDKKGIYSARINQQYRLEFRPINDPGYDAKEVIEVDVIEVSNHYKKI